MQFEPISEDRCRVVPNLRENALALRMRVNALVATLQKYFSHEQVQVATGVTFRPVDNDPRMLAEIETPVGKARLVVVWGYDDEGISSTVVVEKARVDERDRTFWAPVWGIKVPRISNPYAGSGPDRISIPLNDSFGESLDDAICKVGRSLIAAIAVGSH